MPGQRWEWDETDFSFDAPEEIKTDAFNPNQPRDKNGEWAGGGSGGSASPKDRATRLPRRGHEEFTNPSARSEDSVKDAQSREKASQHIAQHASPEELAAIKRYTGGDWDKLRSGNTEVDVADRAALHSAIAKAEKVNEPATLYRGAGVGDSALGLLLNKDEVKLSGITSWSTHAWVAADFADKSAKLNKNRVVLKVRTKSGLPVQAISKFPEEEESILAPKSYRVVDRRAITLPNGDHYATLIHLEEK